MTELDLGLKVGTRALLWTMGYSTRLDVVLRGDRRTQNGSKTAPETFTDLDVLGVQVSPGYRLTTAIADCKSGKRDKPTARMFWARGVADLFGADHIYLVREHEVNDATRQLSSRLKITVLPTTDLAAMQSLHGPVLDSPTSPLNILFNRTAVAENLSAFTDLDRRLNPLLEYRDFDYWVYEHHRNLIQLVAHLEDAATRLDPTNPVHLALFLDLAWLYLVAVVRVTEHIRGAFLTEPDRGLQEYLFGGATALEEKRQTAAALQEIKPANAEAFTHLPRFYGHLRELVTRVLRRPTEIQDALRYAEVASALMAGRRRTTLKAAFADAFDPVAAKLVADVCGFLVASANLNPAFRTEARAYLLAEPVNASATEERTGGAGQPRTKREPQPRPADLPQEAPLSTSTQPPASQDLPSQPKAPTDPSQPEAPVDLLASAQAPLDLDTHLSTQTETNQQAPNSPEVQP